MSSASATAIDPLTQSWRWRIFASTYLCYFGLYFCRKPFYVAKAGLGEEFHLSATELGWLGSVFLLAYTFGQFVVGAAGNKWGPRVMMILGMAASIAANLVFGVTSMFALFVVAMSVNGLAQATGWAGGVGTMGNWFHRRERGTVMGWWATNYQVGGFAATFSAAWLVGQYGYAAGFFSGAAVLFVILLFFIPNQRNRPQDVGLAPVEDPVEVFDDDAAAAPAAARPLRADGWSRDAIITVLLVGTFYFFIKLIRYALFSWVPYFLNLNYAFSAADSGYFSTIFDFAGIPGVIIAGWLSDRFFHSRRTIVSFLFLLGLVASCLLMWQLGDTVMWVFVASLGLIGFTLYGPDALMSGAGAIEVGSPRNAMLAAGIINGMGQLGAVLQELIVGTIYDQFDHQLGPIFALLLGAACIATALLAVVLLRNRLGHSNL